MLCKSKSPSLDPRLKDLQNIIYIYTSKESRLSEEQTFHEANINIFKEKGQLIIQDSIRQNNHTLLLKDSNPHIQHRDN